MTLIDSLRERPHRHKRVVAGGVAAGVTALLGGMWLMTSPFDLSGRYGPVLAEGQAQVILGVTGQDVQVADNAEGTINILPSTTATPNSQPAQTTGRGDVLMTNPGARPADTETKIDQAQDSVFDNPDAQTVNDSNTSSWFTY